MTFTEANRSMRTGAGLNWKNGERAGSQPTFPLAGLLILTEAGKNAMTADGHLCPTSRGRGRVITTADGRRWASAAAGRGCRAPSGRHRGFRGGKAGTKPVSVGRRSHPKPGAGSVSASVPGLIQRATSDRSTTPSLMSAISVWIRTSAAAAFTTERETSPSSSIRSIARTFTTAVMLTFIAAARILTGAIREFASSAERNAARFTSIVTIIRSG